MQIICISRGGYSQGKELAARLAEKLDFECVSREEILEEADHRGIPVKQIETAMIKPHYITESLLLAKEHYLALVTSFLCERALKSNIVYHGRAGHLVLSGISHVFRVRVVSEMEHRIQAVMQQFSFTRERAKAYINQVEENRKLWVKHLYNVDWELASYYDMVINLEQMNVENAAMALCSFSRLPDFQETPASHRALEDLLLASNIRLALAENERTCNAQLKVKSTKGLISVTYQPFQARVAPHIPPIVESIEGVREVHCTMARTNILWIQERFDPSCDAFQHLLDIADKWDAAIELLRFIPYEKDRFVEIPHVNEMNPTQPYDLSEISPQLIVDENSENEVLSSCDDDSGEKETFCDLIRLGRAGGGHCLKAPPKQIMSGIDKGTQYSLVVVGELFLSKGAHARKRLCRELCTFIGEHIKCPVVLTEELHTQFLFGGKQLGQMVICFLCSFILCALLFTYQVPVLRFLTNETFIFRLLSIVVLFVYITIFSYTYGTFSRLLCKFLRLE